MRAAALLIAFALLIAGFAGARAQQNPGVNGRLLLAQSPAPLLSDYRLFLDAGARRANAGVVPYALNTELFADGAVKFRFVYVPEGEVARYAADDVFDFPIGTVLIKTFAIAADMRAPTENVRFLETRLLVRRADGWVAYRYVWNAAQTEARYAPIGAEIPASWIDASGAEVSINWRVPNRNQCKGCHDRDGAVLPIGPSARNLNRDYPYAERAENQIAHWSARGILAGAPTPEAAPRAAVAYDAASGTPAARARAYLDVNCAHCHNPRGPAHTSGLDLRVAATDPAAWGVLKRPVAAGRASGGFEFSIEPGHPERSILVHRMDSTDPGVMMPELGRQTIDAQGVALMRAWIAEMGAEGASSPP